LVMSAQAADPPVKSAAATIATTPRRQNRVFIVVDFLSFGRRRGPPERAWFDIGRRPDRGGRDAAH